jgi:O-antigen ligase
MRIDASAVQRGLLAAFVLGLGFSITLSETCLAVLSILWLIRLRESSHRQVAAGALLIPMLVWPAISLLSALHSGQPGTSVLGSKELLLGFAFYVVVDALPDVDAADRFLAALALVAAAAALMGLVQVSLCPQPEPSSGLARWFFHRCDRARGGFSIYMTLAGVLNVVLLASLPRLLSNAGVRRIGVPAWAITLGGLAATLTRGAWLGFVAGVLSLSLIARRGRGLLLGGLVVLALVALAGPAVLRHRLVSMTDSQDATLKEREYMWRSGLAMWRERPWLGFGPGGVKRVYVNYALPDAAKKRTGHLHNTPLQVLVERGVAGLAAWLGIWIAFYARAISLLRRLPSAASRERAIVAGSLAAITGFLIAGLWEYNFGDSEVIMVAWVVMALPFAVSRGIPSPARIFGAGD